MRTFSIKNLSAEQKILRKRILELSFQSNLSHLGSCLSAIDLIDAVYKSKKRDDIFVLSNGHAGVALYAILEKYRYIKNLSVASKFYIHPDRNVKYGIHVSTGSLGQGLPIAVGMAIADRQKKIFCMLSDGECAEGSIWEALRIGSEIKLTNLKIIINANGWSAYDKVDLPTLAKRIRAFGYKIKKVDGHNTEQIFKSLKETSKKEPVVIFAHTTVEQFSFLKGQDAHYYILKQQDYNLALKALI